MVEGTIKIDRSDETSKLISLSKSALANQNHSESLQYANRALEIDPTNSEAWFLKGTSSGWTSTLVDVRLPEMLGAYKSSIEYAPEDKKDELLKKCGLQGNDIAIALHDISLNHAIEFAQVDDPWTEHLQRCAIIVPILFELHEWSGNRQLLDNIVTINSTLIKGISYTNFEGGNAARFLQPQYQAKVQAQIEEAATKLQKFDSDYTAPKPKPVNPNGGCFVVTATLGNESAFPVRLLRDFRDEMLAETVTGRRFVAWYYENGPKIADVISSAPVLRMLSFIFIVCPATFAAWVALETKKVFSKIR